jgi:RecG-like helicase
MFLVLCFDIYFWYYVLVYSINFSPGLKGMANSPETITHLTRPQIIQLIQQLVNELDDDTYNSKRLSKYSKSGLIDEYNQLLHRKQHPDEYKPHPNELAMKAILKQQSEYQRKLAELKAKYKADLKQLSDDNDAVILQLQRQFVVIDDDDDDDDDD